MTVAVKNKFYGLYCFLVGLLFFLGSFIIAVCRWVSNTYGVGLNELINTLTSPLQGTGNDVIIAGVKACLPMILMVMALCVLALIFLCHGRLFGRQFPVENRLRLFRGLFAGLGVGLVAGAMVYAEHAFGFIEYFSLQNQNSGIYEEYYVDPDEVSITADGDTKNLIYIYLESMETTYASRELGGNQEVNYISGLTALAQENISFSNSETLGGFHPLRRTGWTIAALLGTTSGVPYAFPVEGNSMGDQAYFAPGLTTLGDILADFGYTQEFLCGSNADFAGRRQYFEQHGEYRIFDLFTAREQGYIPEDYEVWWGYEDAKLYEIAKEELLRLEAQDEPFNFTMLTVDTHHIDGYVCQLCEDAYGEQAANVVACADRQISEFIDWCKAQDFYEDSVIIITGDHPRMDTALVDGVEFYDRTIYNCFLNAAATGELRTTGREWTALDMFPTTLAAMGFAIEGDRLGLGVNLFSNETTLCEQLGYELLEEELLKSSEYYTREFYIGDADLTFMDVDEDGEYYDAVMWAADEGIVYGSQLGRFSPDAPCDRGQALTFVWRAMGEPSASISDSPVPDAAKTEYYYLPVLWAAGEGFVKDDGTPLEPTESCTVGGILTLLWQVTTGEADGTVYPETSSTAVNWAVEQGLITGDTDLATACTRAQMAMFLYALFG